MGVLYNPWVHVVAASLTNIFCIVHFSLPHQFSYLVHIFGRSHTSQHSRKGWRDYTLGGNLSSMVLPLPPILSVFSIYLVPFGCLDVYSAYSQSLPHWVWDLVIHLHFLHRASYIPRSSGSRLYFLLIY